MRAEQLSHRITIQAPTITRNAHGAEVPVWTDLATVWASIEPLTGREYWEAQKINAEISHKVKMRYRVGIRPDMRLKFGVRYFDILSAINHQERNTETWLLCRERVN